MANDDALDLTYDEIKILAAKVNPKASVRINRSGYWEIYIPTFTKPVTVLSSKFDGTPAAELIQEEGVDALWDWSKKQTLHAQEYMVCLPLDGIAEYYNFNHLREGLYNQNKEELKEQGVSPEMCDFSARVVTSEQVAGELMMLNLRWLPLI